jgi:hypothetical protein
MALIGLIGRFAVRCTLIPDALLEVMEWGSGCGTAEGEHRCCEMWENNRDLLVTCPQRQLRMGILPHGSNSNTDVTGVRLFS